MMQGLCDPLLSSCHLGLWQETKLFLRRTPDRDFVFVLSLILHRAEGGNINAMALSCAIMAAYFYYCACSLLLVARGREHTTSRSLFSHHPFSLSHP
jgi:predicted SprT family Zn-dependent metalloprotease